MFCLYVATFIMAFYIFAIIYPFDATRLNMVNEIRSNLQMTFVGIMGFFIGTTTQGKEKTDALINIAKNPSPLGNVQIDKIDTLNTDTKTT